MEIMPMKKLEYENMIDSILPFGRNEKLMMVSTGKNNHYFTTMDFTFVDVKNTKEIQACLILKQLESYNDN